MTLEYKKMAFSCFWLRILQEFCSWVSIFLNELIIPCPHFSMLTNGIFIEKHLQHNPPTKSNLIPVFWFLNKISFASKENANKVWWAYQKKMLTTQFIKILSQKWLKKIPFQYIKCHNSINIWQFFSDHFLAVNYW